MDVFAEPRLAPPGPLPVEGPLGPPAGVLAEAGAIASPAGPSANPEAGVVPALRRVHTTRLRALYRSAGWPCHDLIEVELLAAGMLERITARSGHESLRVTDAGLALLARTLVGNRAARSAHETLVEQVAREMLRGGRIAWRGLSLRAQVPGTGPDDPLRWCVAMPDVFSIRNTTVESYVEPVVHEIKVRRADLLGDLRNPAKRAAYLDMSSECWYVLGNDARGRCIAAPQEVPLECGVMGWERDRLVVLRYAPRRAMTLPFATWMALAKATPMARLDEGVQAMLGEGCDANEGRVPPPDAACS